MTLDPNVVKRIVVAIVGLPLTGAVLWLGGGWFAALCGLAAAIAANEYLRLALKPSLGANSRGVGILAAGAMPLAPWLWPSAAGAALFLILAVSSMLLWLDHLASGPRPTAPTRIGHTLAGVLFCAPGLVALSALRLGEGGLYWAAAVLAATWANDTAAFFGGRKFGRHKLFPMVSPKKTWEGWLFGAAGSGAIMLGSAMTVAEARPLADSLVVALVTATLGPLGDLCKSLLKRAYGVKDSGRLFPGHGGMLDRIDAVLFNAPAIWIYVSLTG